MKDIQILILHGSSAYEPCTLDSVVWTTSRRGAPSTLKFRCVNDGKLNIEEGDAVTLKYNENGVFLGYIFQRTYTPDYCEIIAYDQLRYLKAKDSYIFKNKTASDIIKQIASDYELTTGDIVATVSKPSSKIYDNQTLFDIINEALDVDLTEHGKLYTLYDEFGKLTLREAGDMTIDSIVVDSESMQSYDYISSIDKQTYNQIKLAYDNKETGVREFYELKDSKTQSKWGVLQYFEKVKSTQNIQDQLKSLLKLYNSPTRTLKLRGVAGHRTARAGTWIPVILTVGDKNLANYMLIDSATHTWRDGLYTMDLDVIGGELNE